MKEELLKLAETKKDLRKFLNNIDDDETLYLCSLFIIQKWMRDTERIHLYIVPYGENKGWAVLNTTNYD